MKKNFKLYIMCWTVLLALFNAICFIIPNEIAGVSKFGGAFWVGYAFITLAFIGQLFCAYLALAEKNSQKLFYNLPLITVSYTGLVLTVVFGAVAMAIPNLPKWIGAVVGMLVLCFTAIAVIKASAAADIVEATDEKIKSETSFVKNLTAEAENLVLYAKDESIKSECKKIYEAIRYSDPISNPLLSETEKEISAKMTELKDILTNNDLKQVCEKSDELLNLIKSRNSKCKIYK